jgi:hypothetical protein
MKKPSLPSLARELLDLSDENAAVLSNTLMDIQRALMLQKPEEALQILNSLLDAMDEAVP